MPRGLVSAVLVGPAAIVLILLFLVPQIGLLGESFTRPAPIGIGAYLHFFSNGFYVAMLGRTFLTGVVVSLSCLVCGFPLAFWLARMPGRFAPFLLLLATFPLWVSAVVRSFSWMVLFFRAGLLSELVRGTGLVSPGFQFMGTIAGVAIALAQVLLPLMVLMLFGIIRSIDPDLENAAMNLGASPAGAIWRITLPLASGGILAGLLLVFSLAVGAFATPSLIGGGRAHLMAVGIQEQTLVLLDWPMAAAMSVIVLIAAIATALVSGRMVERTAVV